MQHDFILLDRSGSMETLWVEALNSVNAYVAKLAEDKIDTGVTLACFDQEHGHLDFQILRDRIIPRTWHKVTSEDAKPRGMTPLNDAVGKIVHLADQGLNGKPYEKVAIIIMTDGMENCSRELSVSQAKALLDHCRAKNWQVIFLGANWDNMRQGQSYGASTRQTVASSTQNLSVAMASAGAKRSLYSSTGASMDWAEDEKTELAKGIDKGSGP